MHQSKYHPQGSSEGRSTMPMQWWYDDRCGGRKPSFFWLLLAFVLCGIVIIHHVVWTCPMKKRMEKMRNEVSTISSNNQRNPDRSIATHLIHLPPQDHKIRIQKFQIFVTIMHPDGITRSTMNCHTRQATTANEGMSTIPHRINHGVDHPSIQKDLCHIVNDHGFGQQ